VRSTIPHEFARFCRDCFLLARVARPGENGQPQGRAWEQEVSSLLWRPGFNRRQHAGTLGLFGRGSASGAGHEIDGAGHGPDSGIWVEAKAGASIGNADVALFRFKCDDLYMANVRLDPTRTAAVRWWPVLVSSTPASDNVRRLCMASGIVLCDPAKLPLPTILRQAANPEADLHFSETLLAEAVRLFEPPCRSIQERWLVSEDGRKLEQAVAELPTAKAIADTIFIQDTLTADILDHMDLESPGSLDRIGAELAERLRGRVRPLGQLSGAR
jgi:hypothetical protein